MLAYRGSNVGSSGGSDVYERVVDGVSDGANVFFRRTSGGSDHARFYECDAERRQQQYDRGKWHERNRMPNTCHPRSSERAHQEIRAGENEIRKRQSATKAHAIGNGATEDGEKPDGSPEESG